MMTIGLLIGLLALVGGLLVILRRPAHQPGSDDRDPDVLEAAEREVRDLDATTSPEEADDELKDWGPGAPP